MWLSSALCASYSPSPSSTSLVTSTYEMMRITVLTKVPSRWPSIQLAMRLMSLCSHLVQGEGEGEGEGEPEPEGEAEGEAEAEAEVGARASLMSVCSHQSSMISERLVSSSTSRMSASSYVAPKTSSSCFDGLGSGCSLVSSSWSGEGEGEDQRPGQD